MKKWIIILLVMAILLAALCLWQRNNIKALYLFVTNDKEGVEKIIEDNRKDLEDKVKEYGDDMPRSFTPEEEEKIASGEISMDEAVDLLLSEETSSEAGDEPVETSPEAEEPKTEKTNETVVEDGNKVKSAGTEIIKRYTAKFYSLKAYYIGQLSGIEAQAKRDFAALTKEQKKSLSKVSFASKYINYALALESECDSQVESLLSEMKAELAAAGADTSIIGVIKQAYSSEKAAKKADYMSILK